MKQRIPIAINKSIKLTASKTDSIRVCFLFAQKSMKLLNEEVLNQFRQIGNQSNTRDPIVVCKFFNPTGAGTWFATEYDEESQIFFGYVSIFGNGCDEWGSFSLYELESFVGKFGIGIERDLWFTSERFSEVAKTYKFKVYA